MAFLPRLRMNNVFRGNMFTPLHGADVDPYEEIIRDFQTLQQQPPMMEEPVVRPNIVKPTNNITRPEPQLKFGGMTGGDSNPGADIMARSRLSGERLYNTYKQPQAPVESNAGPSRDAQHFANYFKNKNEQESIDLDREVKKTNLDLSKRRVTDQEARTQISDYKAKNPNKQLKVIDGKLYSIDPKDGKPVDTGIKGLSREDEMEIEHKNRLDEIDARLKNTGNNTVTPSATMRDVLNRAQKFQIDFPNLAKYISFDGNKISIDADAYNDKDDKGVNAYDAIRKALYPDNYNQAPNQTQNNTTGSPAPVVNEDRIRVRNKTTGKTGTILSKDFDSTRYDRVQ